jgi:hypothetical protein
MHYGAVLGLFVIDALGNALTTAQLSYDVFATQAIKYNPNLLFR